MPRVFLFVSACLFAGLGRALGSMLGNAAGKTGVWIGGVLGGLAGALASAALARTRGWIAPSRFRSTALWAMLGFLPAAAIAVNTLSSPIGPLLTTVLVGLGAVFGSSRPGSPDAAA